MKQLTSHKNNFRFFFSRILLHKFLADYSFVVLFAFGSLLIFEKSGSVLSVLIFFLLSAAGRLFMRTLGLRGYLAIAEKLGPFWTMSLGVSISAVASVLIFFIELDNQLNQTLFFLLPLIIGLGRPFYTNISNALFFTAIGAAKSPGSASSKLFIVRVVSGVLAALTGFLLNFFDNFLFLFVLQAILFIVSLLPLRDVYLPPVRPMSLIWAMRRLSKGLFFANINPDHELRVTALPIIIALLFGSIDTSIAIVSLLAFVNAIISYFAGKMKDRGNRNFYIFVGIILSLVWIVYGLISTELAFVVLGTLHGFVQLIVIIGRESRMSREIVNSGSSWESTIAVEAARSFGVFLSLLIMVLVYWVSDSLPQSLLITGAFWVIPLIIYASGSIDKIKRKSSLTTIE